ncbi:hypothetical protein [Bifidobacterium merycicum]|uniref:Uncharacterized protein n=1 Tax=Bifidobacterium merycicum TaxID=78345 RepID=A0A087BH97_9BIFI|nr:hypothetical protein [Bifidobacterium merycicum]KFI70397.1 hypothetical protein BMERY_0891 [Bifidobacterium merycicum]SHE50292.1 hypothetical protein SAMN02745589_0928 [Bifidobacterium merycicum DSM 6492]
MTEREKRETLRTFSLICQTSANTGITAARKGDTETTIHTAQQIIHHAREIIRLINTAD